MKAKLTLEIEGSKEEIDIITQRIQNIIKTERISKSNIKKFYPLPIINKNDRIKRKW